VFLHKWVLASLRHMEYVEVYFSFHFTVDEDQNNITCIGQAKNKGFYLRIKGIKQGQNNQLHSI
jgi:hypothetical protein